jgi:hypothetical protein
MTLSGRIRAEMATVIGTKVEKLHPIRWGVGLRLANQLVDNFQAVVDRLRDGGMGCDNLIDSIINQLDRPANGNTPSGENSLRLELAIIKDTGVMIANFTNAMEGDGFLAPDAFDAWHAVLDHE